MYNPFKRTKCFIPYGIDMLSNGNYILLSAKEAPQKHIKFFSKTVYNKHKFTHPEREFINKYFNIK